ncbi:hypothetical protein Tco_0352501 [Tanacetum coccineum]
MEELRIAFQAWSDNIRQKKEQEDKRIAEDQVAKARYWKIPIFDDDDEEYTIAITPVLPTEKPDNSLSMGDEHLSTIPETESDELIKSSVENLVPIPSESEDECECDVPDCDDSQTTNFSTFSNPLFDDSTSSDDESSHEEVIHEISFKTYSNPLFDLDEEIISSEFNPIHNKDLDSTPKNGRFDTESYLLESLLNHDTLMASSPKIDSFFDEFPDFHTNPNTFIESLPTFPIPVEDSDSLREEIDIFPSPDDSIPPGIESDDYDSEGDDNSTSLPEFESFHVDYPDSGDSTIDVVENIPVDIETRFTIQDIALKKNHEIFFATLSPDCPDFEAHELIRFSPSFTVTEEYKSKTVELQILSFIMGIQYPHIISTNGINSVISDSDESEVTYKEVSSPFEDLSDMGSPRTDDHEYLELPGIPEDPYAPPLPNYVPGPEHTDAEIVTEDQLGAEDASPTAQSPDYVPESDPEADPEEDDDEDPEEDHADDEEEEEEHLAPADSVVVALPAADQAPSAEETEPFETDESAATPPPHPAYRVTARISIPAPVPTPLWSDAEVARLLAISTPPSSPLSPWSSPLPQIPSPSLPLSPPSPVLSPAPPPSPIRSLGYRAAMIRMRAEAASTSHSLPLPPPFILSPTRPDAPSLGIPPPLPISVPTSSPPLLLPSASRREDRPEVTLPPRKRLGIALSPGYEVGESSSAAAARPARGLRTDYGFVATMDREIDVIRRERLDMGSPTSFETRFRQDTNEVYTRLDDEQSQRQLLAGRLNMFDLARGEVMSLRTTILAQMSEIRELHAADRRRQAMISEMLKADQRRSAEMRELRTADHT